MHPVGLRKKSFTYIDHNSLFTHLLQSESCADSAPVKFYRASDSVDPTAQDDYLENELAMVISSPVSNNV